MLVYSVLLKLLSGLEPCVQCPEASRLSQNKLLRLSLATRLEVEVNQASSVWLDGLFKGVDEGLLTLNHKFYYEFGI